jgi:hypothetical protein
MATREETVLVQSTLRRCYYPGKDGLYFFAEDNGRYFLRFLPGYQQPARTLYQFPSLPAEGFDVSPGERYLYFGQAEKAGTELQVVPDFWRH